MNRLVWGPWQELRVSDYFYMLALALGQGHDLCEQDKSGTIRNTDRQKDRQAGRKSRNKIWSTESTKLPGWSGRVWGRMGWLNIFTGNQWNKWGGQWPRQEIQIWGHLVDRTWIMTVWGRGSKSVAWREGQRQVLIGRRSPAKTFRAVNDVRRSARSFIASKKYHSVSRSKQQKDANHSAGCEVDCTQRMSRNPKTPCNTDPKW